MTFDPFVLPFSIGLIYLLVVVAERFRHWFVMLPPDVRRVVRTRIISKASSSAAWEIIREALLHLRLWRQNKLLGYMHMSFALGWFLLILIGNLESRLYSQLHINPPYYPIFLKFFVHDSHVLPFELTTIPGFFRFTMDLLLLFVLSGLGLALFKRSKSRWFGMAKTTRHNTADWIALTALWLIFPLRLLAESITAGSFGGGGFLTGSLGRVLSQILPTEHLYYPMWWAYSTALGVFFVLLPYTRYMHIPAEMAYILLKHWGGENVTKTRSFYECGLQACSRCGVCIDGCQVANTANSPETAPVYFLRELRAGKIQEKTALNCLMCGRCQEVCPVDIGLINIRLWSRKLITPPVYPPPAPAYPSFPARTMADVALFTGCMSQLSPGLVRAVLKVLDTAGVRYHWIDAEGSICCGRPMLLSGRRAEAQGLIESNRAAILATGAKTLLTNCPICYKVFKEDYNLDIEVLHHADYLATLMAKGLITHHETSRRITVHIPCELGRKSQPAHSLKKLANELSDKTTGISFSEICCGGSLGSLADDTTDYQTLCSEAGQSIASGHTDTIVTACPLCKKTIGRYTTLQTMDVAELLAENLTTHDQAISDRRSP